MGPYRMREIVHRTDRSITNRFSHGMEKMLFTEDLRYRYPELTEQQAEKLMQNANLSCDGRWLLFGEDMEFSTSAIYNYICPNNIYGILTQRDAERRAEVCRE